MPLRDHFRPPLDKKTSWEGFHGSWPAVIVMALNRKLPPRYLAEPRVHLGVSMEIDVTAFDEEMPAPPASGFARTGEGGVATAVWAPPRPTFAVATDLPDQYAYEVRVFDTWRDRRLVAAVELVSPANKDRPENRRAFVTKCAALLQQRVSVAIVDLVTTRQFNLYGDLLDLIGQADPAAGPSRPRCMPPPAAGRPRMRPGGSRPGPTPSPSASRCRHCHCGWPTISPCRWSWKRATRRPAGSSAWRERGWTEPRRSQRPFLLRPFTIPAPCAATVRRSGRPAPAAPPARRPAPRRAPRTSSRASSGRR